MTTNKELRLQQTLRDLSHLNLSSHIVADVMVWAGGGGFGEVFQSELSPGWQTRCDRNIMRLLKAENVTLDRTKVAVKQLRTWVMTGEGGKTIDWEKKLCRELEIWAGLSHPNILPLLGYVLNWRGAPYPSFVSPWMENGTLRSYYRSNTYFNPTMMAEGIASGLSYLHSQDIVHSDLKCDNILISPLFEPLLTDFGLSRKYLAEFSAKTSLKRGTFRWYAPELFNKLVDRASKETDMWAFGMTILELLTKDIPYTGVLEDHVIYGDIKDGILPSPPNDVDQWPTPQQHLWLIYQSCCQIDSMMRPNIHQVHEMLLSMTNTVPPKYIPRRIIICIDGAIYASRISGLWQFYDMLEQNEEQIKYYAYAVWVVMNSLSATDLIKSTYIFLMDHYQKGDKIYIFGFSKGAGIARELVGMIHKIGILLPKRYDLFEQAYEKYQRADDLLGCKNSLSFKRLYSVVENVEIQFLGIWEAMPVGFISEPRHTPFSSFNTPIHYIRHAVSLDETSPKFEPQLYRYEDLTIASEMMKKEIREKNNAELQAGYPNREGFADLKEVWFAGSHRDVGGRPTSNGTRHSLACIPLRWMVHECFRTNSGIQFRSEKLQAVGLDPSDLTLYASSTPRQGIANLSSALKDLIYTNTRQLSGEEEELRDALCPMEERFVPFGSHTASRVAHSQEKAPLLVHCSVKLRIEAGASESVRRKSRFEYLRGYQPKVKFEVEPIWVD